MIDDPDFGWPEPETLIFGKSYYASKPTDDVFANLEGKTAECFLTGGLERAPGSTSVTLDGPWGFYGKFRKAHCLQNLPVADPPEIAVKSGSTVSVPLTVHHDEKKTAEISIVAEVPQGWKVTSGAGKFLLPAEASTNLRVDIDTATLPEVELKKSTPRLVSVKIQENGKFVGEIKINVLLKASALQQ
jgi:hypothetical protein